MGIIADIVDIIVPRVQERRINEDIGIKEALDIELNKMGYMPKEDKVKQDEIKD